MVRRRHWTTPRSSRSSRGRPGEVGLPYPAAWYGRRAYGRCTGPLVAGTADRHGDLAWFKPATAEPTAVTASRWPPGLDAVYVRDSKAVGDGPVLRVGRDEWAAFVALTAG
ncbi:DUF397 domain-containing protein [Streptomyces sp. GC420]|nr:DUF397 domain-containing protein [Streptomyces sp. GC420]